MFAGWDNFYLMIGSAAGALIGLLFVVATLTGNLGQDKAELGARLYLTPTVFHFAMVLVSSALTAVPHLAPTAVGGLFGVSAAIGLIYSIGIGHGLRHPVDLEAAHWTDFWCYGFAPGAIYVAQALAALGLAMQLFWAFDALAVALLALLLISIRNAWDLVVTISPMVKDRP